MYTVHACNTCQSQLDSHTYKEGERVLFFFGGGGGGGGGKSLGEISVQIHVARQVWHVRP